MEVLLLLVMGAINIACFMIGAKVAQTVMQGEPVEVPELNPMKAAKAHRERKEAEMERNVVETIMRNIDNYDGTPYGQEDVPRG